MGFIWPSVISPFNPYRLAENISSIAISSVAKGDSLTEFVVQVTRQVRSCYIIETAEGCGRFPSLDCPAKARYESIRHLQDVSKNIARKILKEHQVTPRSRGPEQGTGSGGQGSREEADKAPLKPIETTRMAGEIARRSKVFHSF